MGGAVSTCTSDPGMFLSIILQRPCHGSGWPHGSVMGESKTVNSSRATALRRAGRGTILTGYWRLSRGMKMSVCLGKEKLGVLDLELQRNYFKASPSFLLEEYGSHSNDVISSCCHLLFCLEASSEGTLCSALGL